MNYLNICIDIDGTITDPYYWLDFANSYFNLNVTKDMVTQYELYVTFQKEKKLYKVV